MTTSLRLSNHLLQIIVVAVTMSQELIQNHYKVLALPHPLSTNKEISYHDIKLAYRRALLRNHPDKREGNKTTMTEIPTYTIDQITFAFKILGNPVTRTQHNRSLELYSKESHSVEGSHPGLDTTDLDDFISNEEQRIWYRSCRCGNEQGFTVTEDELEKNAKYGEVIIGCCGCSLWLRVTFATSEGG